MRQSLQWINIRIKFWLFEETPSSQKYFYGLCCIFIGRLSKLSCFWIKNRKSPFQVVVVLDRARLVEGYWVEQVAQFVQSLKKICHFWAASLSYPRVELERFHIERGVEENKRKCRLDSSQKHLSLCAQKNGALLPLHIIIYYLTAHLIATVSINWIQKQAIRTVGHEYM